jgi:hypothetical protein
MPVVYCFAAFGFFCASALIGCVVADLIQLHRQRRAWHIGSRKSNPAGGSGNVRQPGTGMTTVKP